MIKIKLSIEYYFIEKLTIDQIETKNTILYIEVNNRRKK